MPQLNTIGGKLTSSFAVLLATFLLLAAASLYSFSSLKEAQTWTDHTHTVLEEAGHVIESIINQETGVRGFLVSGMPGVKPADTKFLEPYHAGKKQFRKSIDELMRLTSDNPDQQRRLRGMISAEEEWRSNVAEKEIKLGLDAATLQQARDIEASGAGKTAMDGFRKMHAEFVAAERKLLASRSVTNAQTKALATNIIIFGSGITIVLALVFGWLLNKNIAIATRQLNVAMQDVSKGDYELVLPFSDRTDEIGAMAKTIKVFQDNGRRNKELEEQQELQRINADKERNNAIEHERKIVAKSIGDAIAKLASKDLSFQVTDDLPDAYAGLKADLNSALQTLADALNNVQQATDGIKLGATELASASDQLSSRTQEQAATLEETSAAIEEISTTVQSASDGSKEAMEIVGNTKADAVESGKVVKQAIEAMSEIESSSKEISQIITVIDEIAFQTNLLALNAGVEAARAGEAGRGFAVVASEVRALAQRSADAAKNIGDLITTSTEQVSKGVRHVGQTGEALERIAVGVTRIDTVMNQIAKSTNEQAITITQINRAVNNLDKVTQENAAMAEEANAATQTLNQQASSLSSMGNSFKTSQAMKNDRLADELRRAAPHVYKPQGTNNVRAGVRKPLVAVNGSAAQAAAVYDTESDQDWTDY